MKRAIIILCVFIFTLCFVSASHIVTFSDGQDSYAVYSEKSYLYNITINNTDIGQDANITQVKITLPENFIFIYATQGTDAAYETFFNTSSILSWSNFSGYLIKGGGWKNFWFNATATQGNYNITITTVNFTDAIQTNISVIVNLCTPAWFCGNWSGCINGTQTRTCIDINSCENETNKPYENKSCDESCQPDWQCTNWSACLNNIQIRSCVDANICGDNSTKPNESQSCGVLCEPNWQCGEWQPEECPRNQIQSRNCTDLNNCNTLSGKPVETRACKYKASFKWLFFVIVGIVSLVIIVVVIVIISLLRKKSKKISPQPSQPQQPQPPSSPPPIQ